MPALNSFITDEIAKLSKLQGIESEILEQFADFVIKNHKKKDPGKKPKKPLTLSELKQAIYAYFDVKDTTALKKSSSFKMATDGLGKLNLSNKSGWEVLYRELIGVLPEEEGETGPECINGINIFKYAMPWRVFGLDSKTATDEDVKKAYRDLCMVHHPDKGGKAEVFDRLTTFYKSLVAEG